MWLLRPRLITAGVAEKKHTYYRCTESRGRRPQPYVREDQLGERLITVVRRVHLTTGQVTQLLRVMREHQDERNAQRIERSEERRRRWQKIESRRRAAYEEKLDRRTSEEVWMGMDRNWSQEQFALKCRTEAFKDVREPSLDDVSATLELLNRAPTLYLRQSAGQRARFLNVLAWDCTMESESIVPNYKSSCDLADEGARLAAWCPQGDLNPCRRDENPVS